MGQLHCTNTTEGSFGITVILDTDDPENLPASRTCASGCWHIQTPVPFDATGTLEVSVQVSCQVTC